MLATVVDILRLFTSQYPTVQIYIEGSTTVRTRLYARILKTYFADFSKDFLIVGVVERGNGFEEKLFDPRSDQEYSAFLVKRKS